MRPQKNAPWLKILSTGAEVQMAPGYMNVRITIDLQIAAELNKIISKSITSMVFIMSYAQ